MKFNINQKINTLILAKKKIRNWYILPIIYLKIYPKPIVKIITREGLKINLRTNTTDFFVFVNIWLLNEYDEKLYFQDSNEIIIDIGAHIGLFTLFVKQFSKNIKILCFEPYIENFKMLNQNLNDNNIENVSIFKNIVSNKNQIISLFINTDNAANNIYQESENFCSVESIKLEKIFEENNINTCDLLKLDCEGAEYEILLNLDSKYYKKINKIIMECHNTITDFRSFNQLKRLLIKENFQIRSKDVGHELSILYAQRRI